MPKATLTLSVPKEIWIGAVSRNSTVDELRVLSAIPSGATGVAVVELAAAEPESIVDDVRAIESTVDVEPLKIEETQALLQIETRLPLLLDAARESGVPITMPFTIRDGAVTWEITASRGRLSELGSQLEAFGVEFTVDSIYHRTDSERFLTDQQWDVLRTAIERGYYDTPRTCTQYELAETLGIARSTCSETLHRAEERVIKRFVEGANGPSEPAIAR